MMVTGFISDRGLSEKAREEFSPRCIVCVWGRHEPEINFVTIDLVSLCLSRVPRDVELTSRQAFFVQGVVNYHGLNNRGLFEYEWQNMD